VEKFLANGGFDKIKAQLVANGAQQKRELYPNKSSTASIHAIFTCLAIVAYRGNYEVAKIDVKGAYIQTEITGSPIYMKMDKKLTTAITTILPDLQDYVTPEGTLYTKLLKALYGCIQSGQLWYARISKESLLLDDAGKKKFHTVVAKLLYLAKRVQPDLLTATSFLCMRVK